MSTYKNKGILNGYVTIMPLACCVLSGSPLPSRPPALFSPGAADEKKILKKDKGNYIQYKWNSEKIFFQKQGNACTNPHSDGWYSPGV